eukprot:2134674-Amphidinium_carterae.1
MWKSQAESLRREKQAKIVQLKRQNAAALQAAQSEVQRMKAEINDKDPLANHSSMIRLSRRKKAQKKSYTKEFPRNGIPIMIKKCLKTQENVSKMEKQN